MKQPLLSLRPLSVSLLLSLAFVFHCVNSLDNSYDEESDLDLNESECGIPDIEPKVGSRIVGGVEARPHSWPWQAIIKCLKINGKTYGCGGSVLDSRWVITAAHCVYGVSDPADCEIFLGKHNRTKKERTEQKFIAHGIIMHEEYDNITVNNDIALIRLPEHARFNPYVKPICLPDHDVKDGTYCVATGWGRTYSTGDENVLNQVYLPVISNKKCNQRDWHDGMVTDDMICAGYSKVGKSGCNGDSGGPLACLSDRIWKLFGVTSWIRNTCLEPKNPTVFTRVMNYIDWIREKTEQYDNWSYNQIHRKSK